MCERCEVPGCRERQPAGAAGVSIAMPGAHGRVEDGGNFVRSAQQRLKMKAAGERVMVLNQFVEQEKPDVATATSGAAFRIGRKAAALSKSKRQLRPVKSKVRGRCSRYVRQFFCGREHSSVRALTDTYSAENMQTKLERKATAYIEGLHKEGVSTFSEDHQLALQTDALDQLVIKREAVLDDLALRMVAKHDIFTGGFYMFFFLLFFWVVVDQMQVWKRFDLETAMKQYATEGPDSSAGGRGRRGSAGDQEATTDVKSIDDVFPWLQTTIVGSVFPPEEWYNGDAYSADEVGYVVNFNRLVGGFQIVQKRVAANVNCLDDERFGDWAGDCYHQYGDEWRMELPYGPPHDPEKYVRAGSVHSYVLGDFLRNHDLYGRKPVLTIIVDCCTGIDGATPRMPSLTTGQDITCCFLLIENLRCASSLSSSKTNFWTKRRASCAWIIQ